MHKRMSFLKKSPLFVWALLLGTIAFAQETAASNAASNPELGIAEDGLPGFFRVGIPHTPTRGPQLSLAGTGRYGIIESIDPVHGKHHELGGRLAIGAVILPWFGVSLDFDGKYQKHPADDEGKDYSVIGSPTFKLRFGGRAKEVALLGGEVGLWFPGSDAPSIHWSATTITGKLLATLIPWAPFHLGATLGFRLDNSANGSPSLDTMRPGDRVALDVSEFHSLLSGIAMSLSIKAVTLILEMNSQFFLGEGPTFKNSPFIVTFGARYQALSSLSFDLYTDTALNKRPDMDIDAPLLPTPPRFAIMLGARYTWSFAKETPKPVEPVVEPVVEVEPEPIVIKEPEPSVATVTGQILDGEQLPIVDAEVRIVVGENEVVVKTNEEGNYTADDIPMGTATITVTAEYFDPLTFEVDVTEEGTITTPPQAMIQTKVGSQVRGLVRSAKGAALDATIRVLPDKTRAKTNDEGFFEVDLDPGDYTIEISAPGYIKQKHTVSVGDNSVVILNVDLNKK